MKKTRVYELAKEAGLENKALVAKLQDMGYAVKSHSSTLDEHSVNEIRMKLGVGEVRTEEKRIQGAGRTIIRRRTKAVPAPEPVAEAEPAEEAAEEPVAEKVAEEEALPAEEKEPTLVAEEVKEEAVAEPEAEVAEEVEAAPVEPVETPEKAEEEAAEPVTEKEEKAKEPAKAAPAKPEKARKGLAKVIGKAVINIPVEQERKRPSRPKKSEKPKGRPAPAAGKVAGAPAGEQQKEAPAKGKKGKRFVKFHPEPEGRDRGKKGGKKGRRQVDVDVEEVEDISGHLPAGLRIGRGHRAGGKKGKEKAGAGQPAETKAIKKRIKMTESITVADLAHRMGAKANELIAKLMGLGVMATMNQALDVDTATLVAADFGYEVEQGVTEEQTILNLEEQEQGGQEVARPPVVTVMGHVDHGKTSILDAIRKTDVAEGEAGGITQHIGAHYVRSPQGDVVFLDTPGHAAFTEMRSRGAQVTDVVVLVVAADDGVMEQTKEAINHARAAKVPILVAVNKIDKDDADPMRVKRELAELDLVPEDWGGDIIYCETSAKQGLGISGLLENILLQAEILELKADPERRARGHVVEAQLHKGRGPVSTILVEQGTLRVGDPFVAGLYSGRVRSLTNDHGENVTEAGPSTPVEVQGLSGVPQAGDEFIVLADEKLAKSVSAERQMKNRETELASSTKISLDNLFEKLQEGEVKELRVALRSDVQGTLEAFSSAIEKLSTDEVKVKVLHEGTGTITESDVLLAAASDALIIGFNVRPTAKVQELANNEKVDIRTYDVIYHALDDIKNAMVGMLDATFEERVIGTVEVRETFHVSKVGTIAGCYVTDGKMDRNAKVRVLRDGVVVYTGVIASLKRFKDDAKEVQAGYECGMSIENFNDIKIGDVFEAFVMEEVEREL